MAEQGGKRFFTASDEDPERPDYRHISPDHEVLQAKNMMDTQALAMTVAKLLGLAVGSFVGPRGGPASWRARTTCGGH